MPVQVVRPARRIEYRACETSAGLGPHKIHGVFVYRQRRRTSGNTIDLRQQKAPRRCIAPENLISTQRIEDVGRRTESAVQRVDRVVHGVRACAFLPYQLWWHRHLIELV